MPHLSEQFNNYLKAEKYAHDAKISLYKKLENDLKKYNSTKIITSLGYSRSTFYRHLKNMDLPENALRSLVYDITFLNQGVAPTK